MNQNRPSKRWCLFAIAMLAMVLPFETRKLLDRIDYYNAARYVVDTVGVIGVAGYAFNIWTGPKLMWRIFAPIFVVFSVVIFASGLPRLFASQLIMPKYLVFTALLIFVCVTIIGLMSLALLRHGGWLNKNVHQLV